MCNSSCVAARSPRSKCRCSCGGSNHGRGRVERGQRPEYYRERHPEAPEENTAVRKIGLSLLKGAAVGVACAAVPGSCPAILAVSQAAGLAKIVSDVYQAYQSSLTREKGVARAADKAGQAVISTSISKAIQAGSQVEMRNISNAVGTAVDAGATVAFKTDPGTIQAIAAETTYRAMEEGVEGFVSWGVEELRESS